MKNYSTVAARRQREAVSETSPSRSIRAELSRKPPTRGTSPYKGLPDLPAIKLLQKYNQWVAWDYRTKGGRQIKLPLDPKTGSAASVSDPKNWANYNSADSCAQGRGLAGVGFVLSSDDDLTGIDLDACRDPQTGRLEEWASDLVALRETYVEISPSGTGLRLFALGKVERSTKNDQAHVEVYATGRYLTVTGNHLDGTPDEIKPAPKTLAAVLTRAAQFKVQTKGQVCPSSVALPPRAKVLSSEPGPSTYFRNVNNAALQALSAWVPTLFGEAATYHPGSSSYRISSQALGRDLEEDLSITPTGAKDFGVHDMGDSREGVRSPIDLVIEYGHPADATSGARWLCDRLGVAPEDLGWQQEAVAPAGSGTISQDAVARAFADRYANRLRYCHTTGAWFEWSGANWQRDDKRRVFDLIRKLCRELTQGSPSSAIREVGKAAFNSGVERFAMGDETFAVSASQWDGDGFLLGTPGGTVDLRTGILRPSDPRDGITKLTSVAPADTADCTRWLQFLDETTGGDKGLIRFLQQWGGYCLTGDTREHALFFGYGPGGNGKSVFVNVYTGILADYAVTAAMDTFTASRGDKHPTELAMLRGARLVTVSETEDGKSWAEARIKSITGGDAISARFMRQNFFTFMPGFKLLMVGNHRPVLHNVDDAARRRFNIVPFTRRPATPDRELESKLRDEWPSILRWMIDGCLDWLKNGLVRPLSVTAMTDDYLSEQDVFGTWLSQCCLTSDNDNDFTSTNDLFASWAAFAKLTGEEPGRMRGFRDLLIKRQIMPSRNASARGFIGIRIKPEPPI